MKEVIVSLMLVCIVVSGCYVGANPAGDEGHIIRITNKTFGTKSIQVEIRGDLLYEGKSYNLIKGTLDYYDKMDVDVRVETWYTLTYIVPVYSSGQYKYKLLYKEDIYLYPENELVEIDTPESIHEYEWIPLN